MIFYNKNKNKEKESGYNKKIGNFGEKLAVKYLKKQGYKIIGQNIQVGHKEIDILAKIKQKNILVEVKTRTSNDLAAAEDALSRRKIEKLKKALNSYVIRKNLDPEDTRLDFIAVDIDKSKKITRIKHYKDIF